MLFQSPSGRFFYLDLGGTEYDIEEIEVSIAFRAILLFRLDGTVNAIAPQLGEFQSPSGRFFYLDCNPLQGGRRGLGFHNHCRPPTRPV